MTFVNNSHEEKRWLKKKSSIVTIFPDEKIKGFCKFNFNDF